MVLQSGQAGAACVGGCNIFLQTTVVSGSTEPHTLWMGLRKAFKYGKAERSVWSGHRAVMFFFFGVGKIVWKDVFPISHYHMCSNTILHLTLHLSRNKSFRPLCFWDFFDLGLQPRSKIPESISSWKTYLGTYVSTYIHWHWSGYVFYKRIWCGAAALWLASCCRW